MEQTDNAQDLQSNQDDKNEEVNSFVLKHASMAQRKNQAAKHPDAATSGNNASAASYSMPPARNFRMRKVVQRDKHQAQRGGVV
jgi:hypothetical protein